MAGTFELSLFRGRSGGDSEKVIGICTVSLDCCFAANMYASRRLRPHGVLSCLPDQCREISIRGFEKGHAETVSKGAVASP